MHYHTLVDIVQRLQLLDQRPLVHADVGPVEFLQHINALPRDQTVQHILLLELAAVHGLVGAFDLDGHRRLTLFAQRDLLVVTLNRLAVLRAEYVSMCDVEYGIWGAG